MGSERGGPPAAAFYRDRGVFEQTRDRVFAPGWHAVPGVAHLPTGRVVPFTLHPGFLDEPLVAVGEDDGPRVLSNVCTHRGNVVVTEPGSPRELRCGYHGRRFGLDGVCRGMNGMEAVEGFPGPDDALPAAAVAAWAGIPFVALAPERSLDEIVAPLRDRIDTLEVLGGEPGPATVYEVAAHWSLYVENYLEGLHVPYVHPELTRSLAGYTVEAHDRSVLQVGEAAAGDPAIPLPAGHPDGGRRIAAYYVWLYPATMVNVYPWGVSLNVVTPLAPDRTRVTFTPFVSCPDALGDGAGGGLDRVESQDEQIVECVQRGVVSRLARPGPLVPGHEDGVQRFRDHLRGSLMF